MISLLLKNWRFVLDALLIIAVVVFIFLWNPFGIFGGGLKLGTTTNMVTEVREIGQLVTAEYYGEVIASMDESRLQLIYEDSLNSQAELIYADLKHALYNLYQFQQIPRDERVRAYRELREISGDISNWRRIFRQDVDRKNILEKLDYHHEGLTDHPYYLKVVEYLWREEIGKAKNVSWNPNERQEGQVLFLLYNEIARQDTQLQAQPLVFRTYLDEGFTYANDFSTFYYADQTAELPREERKKKLAMVGRGWVKAGFDFGTLDEHTFYFHEESSELHFFGLEPRILNADINPWFIPEKGIPGFEIIDYNGKVDFRDAKKVKKYCVEKLVLYAQRADIIMHAQRQGEATLKSFFSLLTGKEIKKIHFHNDLLIRVANEIARDEFVNAYEAVLLDSLVRDELQYIDSLNLSKSNRSENLRLIQLKQNALKSTLGRLRELPFEDMAQSFGYYAPIAFRIGRDAVIDLQEQQEIEHVRWNNIRKDASKLDTLNLKLWYEDSLTFMMEYNAALEYLMSICTWIENTVDTTFILADQPNWKKEMNAAFTILDSASVDDTVKLTLMHTDSMEQQRYLSGLLYPFQYDRASFGQYIQSRTLFGTEFSPVTDSLLATHDSLIWIYKNAADTSVQSIGIPPDQFVNKHLLKKAPSGFKADTLSFLFARDTIRFPLSTLTFEDSLNTRQVKELQSYYQFLQNEHEKFRDKGAITRASEWVNTKLSDRKSLRFSFAEVKKLLEE